MATTTNWSLTYPDSTAHTRLWEHFETLAENVETALDTVDASTSVRIATDTQTSDSSTFTTTETTVQSVTASLVNGETYAIYWFGHFGSSVTSDNAVFKIREDDDSGTILQSADVDDALSATYGAPVTMYAEYTATSTASKTFVVTGDRLSGSGNCYLEASSERPSYFYVQRIQ